MEKVETDNLAGEGGWVGVVVGAYFPVVETNRLMKSVAASRPILAHGKSVKRIMEWWVGCSSRKVVNFSARQ